MRPTHTRTMCGQAQNSHDPNRHEGDLGHPAGAGSTTTYDVGGKGRRGGDSRPSARDSLMLRLRKEARAGTKLGAHDHKDDNARLTLLTPPSSFPVHA